MIKTYTFLYKQENNGSLFFVRCKKCKIKFAFHIKTVVFERTQALNSY
jgi:hypothetical protein